MKRMLIMKFCSNIRPADKKETNGGNTEINVCIQALKKTYALTVLTISRYVEDLPEGVKGVTWDELNIQTLNDDYDIVFCFNGVLNCFGGVVSKETQISYRIFNTFQNKLIYAVTDTQIHIGDLAGWIRNAHSKEKYLELNADDFVVDGTKISCITQTHDLNCLKNLWKGNENKFKSYVHFPFEKTVCFRKKLVPTINDNPLHKLIYFGNSRGGKRDKKFFEFYCHIDSVQTSVYGNWNPDKLFSKKFKPSAMPFFHGKMDMYELHGEINSSLAHCYISDPANENTITTTRFYETILNRSLLFMDVANDPLKKRFSNDFFYVRDAGELNEKLMRIRDDSLLRHKLIEEQMMNVYDLEFHEVRSFIQLLIGAVESC